MVFYYKLGVFYLFSCDKMIPVALEMSFIFQTLTADLARNPKATALSDRMHTYWANFIKTGDPNGDGSASEDDLIRWEKYETETKQNIVFHETDHMTQIKGLDDIQYAMDIIWRNWN
jgi:carboxylesterase type B